MTSNDLLPTLLALALLTQACASLPATAPPADVRYSIRPVPRADRTTLEVEMGFAGDADGVTRIALPRGRYGVLGMHRVATELRAEGAELAPVAGDERVRDLVHASGAKVVLRYTVDWDPAAEPGSAYRPSVGPAHFHFFGRQWIVTLPERGGEQRFSLAFDGVPEGWSAFSNLGAGAGPFEARASVDAFEPLVAGGDYLTRDLVLDGAPVAIHVRGPFADVAAVADDVERSIRLLTRSFGSGGVLPHFVVSVTGRGDVRAGVAIDNAFVCLVSPDATPRDVLLLVAHETLHNWLPRKATIEEWRGASVDEYRLDWFVEGFTEYLARKALLEAGLLTLDDFVDAFNADLRELARNPMRAATLDEVALAIEERRYTNRHERLNYNRGPLLALRWDLAQTAAGRESVDVVVRAFLDAGVASGGAIPEARFFDLLERHGIDAYADYLRFIVDGKEPAPAPDSFGPEFEREEQVVDGRATWRFVRR